MNQQKLYDYRELAYDLYRSADELLDKLVDLRKSRGMTQQDLADEMNVSQAYISKIENGKAHLVSLLVDYALEVGARVEFSVESAETHSEGDRSYKKVVQTSSVDVMATWNNGEMSLDNATTRTVYTLRGGEEYRLMTVVELPHDAGMSDRPRALAETGNMPVRARRREYANW
jgi:transcriptional regulator with XRE-family HTH domain